MPSGGQHSDQVPMPSGPRFSPEQLGEVVDLLRAVLQQERAVIREELERAMRPVLTSVGWFMWRYEISEATFHREIKRCKISKRDCHGAPWQRGAGPVRYSVTEWERKSAIHTKSIMNDLARRGRR